MNETQVIELAPLWARVWSRRRLIAATALGSALIMVVVSLVVPKWYRAEAALLPPSEEESGLKLTSLLRGIGVPGLKVPTQASPADVFIAIMESRTVSHEMAERFDLKQRYKEKHLEDVYKELRRHSRFKVTNAGTITISVEARSPELAADMANAYVEILDRFNRETRTSKGRRTRLFVEKRLVETQGQLAEAEQRLADYQARKKTIALSSDMTSSIESAARLFAERAALEVRLGVVRSYSRETTDEEIQIRQQLSQLDLQLSALPTTGLALARMLREVKTYEQLFLLLTAEYEDARIAEARDVATVELLDPAVPPEKKSKPLRSVIVIAGFLLGLAVGVAYALVRPKDDSRDPDEATGAASA
jgi:uncharacterized protein involved in exopolysaccharide biosynthesis